MPKHPNDYPRFYMRMNVDMLGWLKDYAQRKSISMTGIIKEQLEQLRRKDKGRAQREAKND